MSDAQRLRSTLGELAGDAARELGVHAGAIAGGALGLVGELSDTLSVALNDLADADKAASEAKAAAAQAERDRAAARAEAARARKARRRGRAGVSHDHYKVMRVRPTRRVDRLSTRLWPESGANQPSPFTLSRR